MIDYRHSPEIVLPTGSEETEQEQTSPGPQEDSSDFDEINFDPILLEDIFPYYKDNFIEDDTKTQKAIIENKKRAINLRLIQLNKHLGKFYKKWPDATPLNIYIAFLKKDMSPEDLLSCIEDRNFKKEVRQETKERMKASKKCKSKRYLKQIQTKINKQRSLEESESSSFEEDSSDDDEVVLKSRKRPAPYTRRKVTKSVSAESNSEYPCPENIDEEIWNSWSEARKKSYITGMKNPNAYLYRHLPPGEEQRNGAWTKQEKALFFARLAEMREEGIKTGKWGIFSMTIPGRVGYQCANYYRKLVASGEIKDADYHFDKEGNLRYKDRQPYHKKASGLRESDEEVEVVTKHTKPRAPRQPKQPAESFYEKMAKQNPLKNKTDCITGEPIQVPAISPDGTVLDYNTWLHILTTTKQDPLTMKHINKRQIVILTNENYADFKDQIKHI